ncbi:hypothetical protein AQUCO_05400031v1 [Aquilegia coerulea]|uniref:Uncharacterized protein n=1 Tax=Aquilegia coerulea TaxID=218851 RepID=A0A2G5CH93_AQUCA|nr:hypothetical protein AQUCO_05400031v1 [Aquilegia coerulea]
MFCLHGFRSRLPNLNGFILCFDQYSVTLWQMQFIWKLCGSYFIFNFFSAAAQFTINFLLALFNTRSTCLRFHIQKGNYVDDITI